MSSILKSLSKAPSIVWVFIFPLGIAAFIGSIIFIFWAIATVEGVASLVMLIAGFLVMRFGSSVPLTNSEGKKINAGSNIAIAMGISFFALMGMAIDQTGNYIYNKPLEILFCEDDSTLNRSVDILHPLPGRTDIIQDFSCYDKDGEFVNSIGMFKIIAIRFVEYVFIGYALLYLNRAINHYMFRKKALKTSPVIKN